MRVSLALLMTLAALIFGIGHAEATCAWVLRVIAQQNQQQQTPLRSTHHAQQPERSIADQTKAKTGGGGFEISSATGGGGFDVSSSMGGPAVTKVGAATLASPVK
jgi:hypothetical protein